jgi:hypothetical protein
VDLGIKKSYSCCKNQILVLPTNGDDLLTQQKAVNNANSHKKCGL